MKQYKEVGIDDVDLNIEIQETYKPIAVELRLRKNKPKKKQLFLTMTKKPDKIPVPAKYMLPTYT